MEKDSHTYHPQKVVSLAGQEVLNDVEVDNELRSLSQVTVNERE